MARYVKVPAYLVVDLDKVPEDKWSEFHGKPDPLGTAADVAIDMMTQFYVDRAATGRFPYFFLWDAANSAGEPEAWCLPYNWIGDGEDDQCSGHDDPDARDEDITPAWFFGPTNEEGEVYGG